MTSHGEFGRKKKKKKNSISLQDTAHLVSLWWRIPYFPELWRCWHLVMYVSRMYVKFQFQYGWHIFMLPIPTCNFHLPRDERKSDICNSRAVIDNVCFATDVVYPSFSKIRHWMLPSHVQLSSPMCCFDCCPLPCACSQIDTKEGGD